MKKKGLQMLCMAVGLLALVGIWFGIRHYNTEAAKKEAENLTETILVVPEGSDEITAFSYDLDGITYQFVKGEDGWVYEGDPEMKLIQSDFTYILYYLVPLTATNKWDAAGLNLEDYGLAEPAQTICITTTQNEYTLQVGDVNTLTGECYVRKDGEDTIYAVGSSLASACTQTPEELKQVEEESSEAAEAEEDIESEEGAEAEDSVEAEESAEEISTEEISTEEISTEEISTEAEESTEDDASVATDTE